MEKGRRRIFCITCSSSTNEMMAHNREEEGSQWISTSLFRTWILHMHILLLDLSSLLPSASEFIDWRHTSPGWRSSLPSCFLFLFPLLKDMKNKKMSWKLAIDIHLIIWSGSEYKDSMERRRPGQGFLCEACSHYRCEKSEERVLLLIFTFNLSASGNVKITASQIHTRPVRPRFIPYSWSFSSEKFRQHSSIQK